MGFILALLFIALGVLIIYYIYQYFAGMKVVATDSLYSQRGLTIDYTAGTMKFRSHTFPVKQISGITLITDRNGNRKSYHMRIDIDDIKKPNIRVPVIGSSTQAESFMQRICVAVRKAGGPNFY